MFRRQRERRELESKLKNYIRVPNLNDNIGASNSKQMQLGSDYNLIVIPPDERAQSLKGKRSDKKVEEEIISKDLMLYKKEKFLAQAMENEKLGRLENAQYYYENAALYAEKLGAFAESLVYFKKFEELEQKILEVYNRKDVSNDFFNRLKLQFQSRKHQDFVNDMKKYVKTMEISLFSKFDSKLKGNSLSKVDSKQSNSSEQSSKPPKKYKPPKGAYTPKNLTMPLVNKKKLEAFRENQKLMESMKEDFNY